MICLENVRHELGKLMADMARKISWGQITESPIGDAKEFTLYLVGNGELVKGFKVEHETFLYFIMLTAGCVGDGLEKGKIPGRQTL